MNYGLLPDGTAPSLQPYIDWATLIVSRVNTCASAKGITLSTPELEMIERWTAAYGYCKMDPLYSSNSKGGASASYLAGGSTLDGETERYKRGAIEVDYSGCLNAILNRKVASLQWIGKPTSEQINIEDRD